MNVKEEKNTKNIDSSLKKKKMNKIVYNVVKRVLDIVFSLLGMVILSPFFLLISIIIKLNSKGPVFFVHSRIGEKGKPIGIYKFRTMVENAEDLIKNFTPEQKEEFERCYKLENDPRVTKIGNFLRKTSLDELPQLFSIAIGKMSFIGPRPWIPDYYENMNERQRQRNAVRPGLTGLAQCMGRNGISIFQKINYDIEYIENYSLKQDLKIIFLTVKTVITGSGADAGKNTIKNELYELSTQDIPVEEIKKALKRRK